MTGYSELQKRCQRGATNLNDANNLLAECYAALGALSIENQRITQATHELPGSLSDWAGAGFNAKQMSKEG